MESVNVNRRQEHGGILGHTIIMQTIRSAVAEQLERRIGRLRYLNPAVEVASLQRFARVNVTMTNVPQEEWGPEAWLYVEMCLANMPDDHDSAPYKNAALGYTNKHLEGIT